MLRIRPTVIADTLPQKKSRGTGKGNLKVQGPKGRRPDPVFPNRS